MDECFFKKRKLSLDTIFCSILVTNIYDKNRYENLTVLPLMSDVITIESFSSDCEYEYEYEFCHFGANTRHVAYAISYLQQKVVAFVQLSTKFSENLVVHTTTYQY